MENQKNEFTLNLITNLSNEIDKFYPELTTFESLKLATEISKINVLNDIQLSIDGLAIETGNIGINTAEINLTLESIDRNFAFFINKK
jgi:hypothetical protein